LITILNINENSVVGSIARTEGEEGHQKRISYLLIILDSMVLLIV